MKAMDVMVRDVVTVKHETDVASAIKLLIEHDISALPVVDDAGTVVGMISEADLLRRAEIGTEKHRPWWLEAVTPSETRARFRQGAWAPRRGIDVGACGLGDRGDAAIGDRRPARAPPHQARSDPQGSQARRYRQPLQSDPGSGVEPFARSRC